MTLLTKKKFSFISQVMYEDAFSVVSFKGFEAISSPYEFDIILVSDNTDIDPLKILQYPAKFTIHRDGQTDVEFNGILTQFEENREFNGNLFFKARLCPRFWWLSLTRHNQVFLDLTVPEIIEHALRDGGLNPGLDFDFQLQNSYSPLEYVCQYDESHFNFVSRWAQREGIYYFFDQTPQGEKLVFTDTKIAHKTLPLGKDLVYSPPSGLDASHTSEVIQSCICRHSLLPQRVYLKDYNYLKPSLAIEGIADVDENGRGENYVYGENFNTPEEGNRLAKIRAEALLCRKSVFSGQSSVPYMVPGYTFSLSRHYKKGYNTAFLVTRVSHEGHQTGYLIAGLSAAVTPRDEQMFYANTFEAIYADVQFRPEHTHEQPRISGTINAKIDAAGSGQFAELDDYGRYKVILPFDRSGRFGGKASAWFRMMQPYAGQNQGMHFPLHKGTEVLLTFIDGDPDRPVIAGAVPNPETASPVTGANQSKSMISTGRSPVDSSVGAAEAFGTNAAGDFTGGQTDNYIEFEDQAPEHIKFYSPNTINVFAGGRYKRREIGPSEETGHDKYKNASTFDPITAAAAETDIEDLKTALNDYAPGNILGYDEKAELNPGNETPPSGFPEQYEKAPVPDPPQSFKDFYAATLIWCNPNLTLTQFVQQNQANIPTMAYQGTALFLAGNITFCSQAYSSEATAWEEYWKFWVHANISSPKGYDPVSFINPLNAANTGLTQPWFYAQDWILNLTVLITLQNLPAALDKSQTIQEWNTHCRTEWDQWVAKRTKEWKQWQVHVTKGHVRVSHRDTFNIQEGNIFDFGGYWNYNMGNCYVEGFMDPHASVNPHKQFDLLDGGGPGWGGWRTVEPDTAPMIPDPYWDSKNELKAWGKGNWDAGNVWVNKSFGDTYEYAEGSTVSVRKGHSQEIIIGGRSVEEKYGWNKDKTGYIKKYFSKSGGGKSWQRKWTKTGFLLSSAHSYTTGLNYEIKNNISYNYGAKTNLSWDFATNASLSGKIGAHTTNEFYLGAKSETELKISASFSLSICAAAKISIALDAALFFKYSGGPGVGMEVKGKPMEFTYKKTNGKFRWNGPGTQVEKEGKLKAKLENLALRQAQVELSKHSQAIWQRELKLGCEKLGITQSQLQLYT